MKSYFAYLTCMKCGNSAGDPDNPEISYPERRDKHNSYRGWMCKCGYYNGTDK